MAHIHTEPNQHDHTVAAFIIRDDGDEPRVFLHLHKKLNTLLPPGGHIELNETHWAAMIHELEEETGYTPSQVEVLQPKLRIKHYNNVIVHPQPLYMNTHKIGSDHWHSDTDYLFLVHEDPALPLADGESSDIRWLNRDEIGSLGNDEIHEDVKNVYLAILDTFLHEWEPVPATDFRTDKG